MQEQRQLLDMLMGRNRNGEAPGAGQFTWTDRKVCRFYLAGLCPESLFTNTRHDLGGCRLVHSDDLREAYQREAPGKYEPELERRLRTLLEDSRRRISKAHDRTLQSARSFAPANALAAAELEKLVAEITALHDEAERLGEEGKVDESKAAFDKAETLKVQQAKMLSSAMLGAGDAQQQSLRVCETCGSYLSLLETDHGLMDHFSGKLHQGYRKIIDMYNALQDRKPAEQRRYFITADDGAFVAERRQQRMAAISSSGAVSSAPPPEPTQPQESRKRSRSKSPQRCREDGVVDWRPAETTEAAAMATPHDSDYRHISRSRDEAEEDEGQHHHHYQHRHHQHTSSSRHSHHGCSSDSYSHYDGVHDEYYR